MNMQIKAIILYNDEGDVRELQFDSGAVNIISGDSNTGKSTIIQIINYCLGQSEFEICEGVTRDAVAWYAVLYQFKDTQVFIGKPKPPKERRLQSRVYYKQSPVIKIPSFSELIPNTDDQEVIRNISRLLGVNPGVSEYAAKLTITDTLFYLFQEKTVIANNQTLFYRQQTASPTIKKTLPYFLGITSEDYLKAKQELEKAQSELRSANYKLRQEETRVSAVKEVSQNVFQEAQRVGLVNPSQVVEDIDIISSILTQVIGEWKPSVTPPITDDRLPELREEIDKLRRELAQKDEEINSIKTFIGDAKGYSYETGEQVMRLESVGLFDSQDSFMDPWCPLCDSLLKNPPPRVLAITEAISKLQNDLEMGMALLPELGKHLQSKEGDKEQIKRKIAEKQSAIKGILAEQDKNREAVQQIIDTNSRIERVVGRIGLYLDMAKSIGPGSSLRIQVEESERYADYWTEQTRAYNIESIQESTLNYIGAQMTEWSKKLKLWYKGAYSFEIDKLSVKVDEPNRSTSMEHMGGRYNWLGCHLITLLAFHKYFVEQERPVPNFIVLDQPTQGYFSSHGIDDKGSPNEMFISGDDNESVNRMFDLLFDICGELSPKFQIIILEHTGLQNNSRFKHAIRDDGPWTSERGLIPQSWIKT